MGTLHSDSAWINFGKKNPYFGVLTDDKYLDENLSEEGLNDFFLSGEQYVDNLFETIHNHVDPGFNPQSVLDFGCGTGRLVIPFARKCKHVAGMDISKDILAIAKQNAEKNGLDNISLYNSDDNLTNISDQKFDLINSYIVFQHINVDRGERIIHQITRLLNANGIGALHVTYYRNKPLINKIVYYLRVRVPFVHTLINALQRKPVSSPLIQMNAYNLNHIFYMLQQEGMENCHVSFTNHGDALGVKIIFQKK